MAGLTLATQVLRGMVGGFAGSALATAGLLPALALHSAWSVGVGASVTLLLRPALRGLRALPSPAAVPRPLHPAAALVPAAAWLFAPPHATEAVRAGATQKEAWPLGTAAGTALVYAVTRGFVPVAEEVFYRG